jgi:hypothetical protein
MVPDGSVTTITGQGDRRHPSSSAIRKVPCDRGSHRRPRRQPSSPTLPFAESMPAVLAPTIDTVAAWTGGIDTVTAWTGGIDTVAAWAVGSIPWPRKPEA